MCSYNVEIFIERAIKSILEQTYNNWELIISDDSSKDSTPEIIKKHLNDPRIKYHTHAANMGYVKNKNWAFTQATGDLITQLDADDTCPPQRLEKQVNCFVKNPEIKICGTNYQITDENDNVRTPPKEYPNDFLIKDITKDYPFWFPGLMFRRELIVEFGLFSEYFNGIYGDDYHWTIRVNQKYPIFFIKDILYNYRINSISLTNTFNKNLRKLIAEDITGELFRQQKETGTDWIEKGELDKARKFEETLLSNKDLMAEKYRVWAAKAIDMKKWEQAKSLLNMSFKLKKTSLNYYRTLFYFLRKRAS